MRIAGRCSWWWCWRCRSPSPPRTTTATRPPTTNSTTAAEKIDYAAPGLWDDGPCDPAKPKLIVGTSVGVFESPVISLGDHGARSRSGGQRRSTPTAAPTVHSSRSTPATTAPSEDAGAASACVSSTDRGCRRHDQRPDGPLGNDQVADHAVRLGHPTHVTRRTSSPDDWGDPNAYPMDALEHRRRPFLPPPKALINRRGRRSRHPAPRPRPRPTALKGLLEGMYEGQRRDLPDGRRRSPPAPRTSPSSSSRPKRPGSTASCLSARRARSGPDRAGRPNSSAPTCCLSGPALSTLPPRRSIAGSATSPSRWCSPPLVPVGDGRPDGRRRRTTPTSPPPARKPCSPAR